MQDTQEKEQNQVSTEEKSDHNASDPNDHSQDETREAGGIWGQKSDWDIRPYLAIGALIFLVFCCCIIVFFVIFRYKMFAAGWSKIIGVAQPIIIGGILAYLLNPLMQLLEKKLLAYFLPKAKPEKKENCRHSMRVISSILSLFALLLIIIAFLYLVIPAVINSVVSMADTLTTSAQRFVDWMNKFSAIGNKNVGGWESRLLDATQYAENWFKDTVMPQMQNYVTTLSTGVISVIVWLKNILVGLIVSVYVLIEKEKFEGQCKKIIYAILPAKPANSILKTLHKSNEIFGGFIIGKLIDSLIIGILCFIGCALLRMPYTLLVSVIVGITNIIPFFGPFIGAIPCLIIITITDPLHGLYFLIFVFALQQLDGNVIGPKILGDSTGLSSFWVIVAILFGGGLFGFPGMLFGVPVFAVLYYLMQRIIATLLEKKHLPVPSEKYTDVTHIDPATKKMCTDDWKKGQGLHPQKNK